MSELRKDPISDRWVIISTERARRPSSFKTPTARPSSGGFCPLCPGNEDKTPPEIFACRVSGSAPNTPGWTLRVVSNKFPALTVEGELNREGEGIYDRMSGVGAHEVIIESPHHGLVASEMEPKHFEDVLWAFRERMRDLSGDKRFRFVSVFKNQGEQAGASLEHPHAQLVALPVVPKRMMEELKGAKEYYQYKERCIFCDIVRQEMNDRRRVIFENGAFLAVAPFAPRFPYEVWILPMGHHSSYEESEREDFARLTEVFLHTLRRLDAVLDCPPFNYMLHTSPFTDRLNDYYHWHIEIIPRLTRVAGFEWGSDFYINSTSPEDAAEYLRQDTTVESGE